MKKSGNGVPELCVNNLVRIRRGEVAYERVKGIDGALIDQPMAIIEEDAATDIERQITIFEPRVEVDSVESVANELSGGYEFDIQVHTKETTNES
jgi:hypothetical protein